jgi:hypothetical protein
MRFVTLQRFLQAIPEFHMANEVPHSSEPSWKVQVKYFELWQIAAHCGNMNQSLKYLRL